MTKKIFVIARMMIAGAHFEIFDVESEGPKSYRVVNGWGGCRVFKKSDPDVFTDGRVAARAFLKAADIQRHRIKGMLDEQDKEIRKVKAALTQAEKRKGNSKR